MNWLEEVYTATQREEEAPEHICAYKASDTEYDVVEECVDACILELRIAYCKGAVPEDIETMFKRKITKWLSKMESTTPPPQITFTCDHVGCIVDHSTYGMRSSEMHCIFCGKRGTYAELQADAKDAHIKTRREM